MYIIYYRAETTQTIALGAGQPKPVKFQSPPVFVAQKGLTNDPKAAKIFKSRDEAEDSVPESHPNTGERFFSNENPFQIITSQVLSSYSSSGMQLPATEIIQE